MDNRASKCVQPAAAARRKSAFRGGGRLVYARPRRVKTTLVQEMRQHFSLMGAAYVVFVCGVIGTALSYYWVAQYVLTRDTTRFEMTVREMQSAVEQRSQAYHDALRGLGGLVSAMGSVDRKAWERYLDSLRLPHNYPGIEVVGWLEKVRPQDLPDHVARVRLRGWEQYQGPTNRSADLSFPIALALNPTNQPVDWVGRDPWNDERHRRAMELARDSGTLASTGELAPGPPATANDRAEFAVYQAVYAGTTEPADPAERQARLEGFVFAQCRPGRMLDTLFNEKLRDMVLMDMFDGTLPDEKNLLYSTRPSRPAARPKKAVFEHLDLHHGYQRKYTLRFASLPGFTPVLDRYLPPATFLGGMAVTILLFGIAWTQVKARIESETLSTELRLSEDSLRRTNDELHARMAESAAAKQELQRSLALQLATLESAADGILVVNLDGRIESYNQRFVDLWKVPPHVLAGRADHDFQKFAAEQLKSPEPFLLRVRELYQDPGLESFEVLELKDQRVFERHSRSQRVGGAWGGRVWSFRDVTERHQAEEERKRVHRFLEALIQNTPAVAIQVYDREGRVELWNPASEKLYGYSWIEMKGQPLQDKVLSGGEAEMFARQLDWIWTSQQPLPPFEWTIKRRDGQIRHLYSVMFPVLHGSQTVGVCSADVDITDRKQTEAELQAAHDYVKSLIESSLDMIISTDPEGRIRQFNPSAERVFGLARTAALGHPWTLLFHDPSEASRLLEKTKAEGHFTGEITAQRHSGEPFTAFVSASALRDADYHFGGIMAIARDVTERKRIDAELLQASKLDSIARLASGIAHDFNNLLMVILGNLSLLRTEIDSRHPLTPKLDQMEKVAARGRHLTQQLLIFSKGGAPVKRVMPLTDLLRDAADFSLHGSPVRCQTRLPDDLAHVEIDAGQMNQVFHNLLRNAAEAMPDGGTVEVLAENCPPGTPPGLPLPDRPHVHISIRDHGPGIPTEAIGKIFDPYFTTKQGHSGLGLPVVYSVVSQHQGQVELHPAPDGGTIAHLFLPAALAPTAPAPPPDFLSMTTNRVLVMDDDPVIREVLGSMLTLLGYQVDSASEGTDALARYQAARQSGQPFGAIIMDLSIVDGMGGRETIQQLRALDRDIPVVVSSGYANDPVMVNFRQHGFNGVISKPYQFESLARALVELVPHSWTG